MTIVGLTPYKGRTLEVGQRVKVYRNLHKDTYSIVDLVSGKVVAHSDTVHLINGFFQVKEAGRQRVLREKRKNVHAYVIGTYMNSRYRPERNEAYYNPYRTETFVRRNPSGELMAPIYSAASVTLSPSGVGYTGRF